ncbi:DUF58 domain-containing protein [Natronorubrum sp. JWXQ-INN-674]|uniref:DUF58 domain-containing protein n=1 Tax=Natronorubrum halalkaliphilum TaxID=2691917 RepID=A0A6B0VJV6_9EURY|nr:DUF58 domain-containing protein [Natronorubrum halalkaliphilum]MXV61820.1 DUF58 domain-containing protein [Natronorubrum halalkaliphilum]
MFPTRRLWAAIALAVFLAAFAVVAARPLLLGGAGLIGAWVLTRQYRFLRTLEDGVDSLWVHQSVTRSGVRTTDTIPVTLAATLETDSPLAFDIDAGLPTAAVSDEPLSVSLAPSESTADRTVEVTWPVAGQHRFDEPTVRVSDGFVRETLSVGEAPTITVEPRGPRTIHVGEGGDRIATAYGEHEAGRLGSGLEPAELREYMPGDTADRIDWKATARLGTPHVREYEAATDRQTLLVVDHRASLATGVQGETKLEYLREVALATAASARRLGDPLGFLAVGDAGVTDRLEPDTTPATYNRVRQRLLELEPTSATPSDDTAGDDADSYRRRTGPDPTSIRLRSRLTAADARRKLSAIGGDLEGEPETGTEPDSDPFTSTLRPFYANRTGYRKRIESKPLYGAVRTAHNRGLNTLWTVIFTDDSRPAELRETVKLARSNDNAVLVLLAPSVLYEPGGLADVERAYDRYVEFEELRRDLARMSRVTALEVGPTDRLSTVLSSGRTRARGGRV